MGLNLSIDKINEYKKTPQGIHALGGEIGGLVASIVATLLVVFERSSAPSVSSECASVCADFDNDELTCLECFNLLSIR